MHIQPQATPNPHRDTDTVVPTNLTKKPSPATLRPCHMPRGPASGPRPFFLLSLLFWVSGVVINPRLGCNKIKFDSSQTNKPPATSDTVSYNDRRNEGRDNGRRGLVCPPFCSPVLTRNQIPASDTKHGSENHRILKQPRRHTELGTRLLGPPDA